MRIRVFSHCATRFTPGRRNILEMRFRQSRFQRLVGWSPRISRQHLFEGPLDAVGRFFDELKLHGAKIGLIASAELDDLQGIADVVVQFGDGPHPFPDEFLFFIPPSPIWPGSWVDPRRNRDARPCGRPGVGVARSPGWAAEVPWFEARKEPGRRRL